MINTKKLISMAKKWKKIVSIGERRISLSRTNGSLDAEKNSKSMANKGHFVVYTCDERRFVIPLVYLTNTIIRELSKMAEEEFGLQSDAPITLPCDAVFMEYIVSLVQRHVSSDLEKVLLMSMGTSRCSVSSLHEAQANNQLLVQSF